MGKDKILQKIRQNRPDPVELTNFQEDSEYRELKFWFRESAKNAGIKVIDQKLPEWKSWAEREFADAELILDFRQNQKLDLKNISLEKIDVLIIDGVFGVAENGAIWVDTSYLPARVMPFITQHLVICLPREQILPTMHQAYKSIELDKTGFGVFIAGPSKTGDIEMVLVTGAQGPRSLTVCLS